MNTSVIRVAILFLSPVLAVAAAWLTGSAWVAVGLFALGVASAAWLGLFGAAEVALPDAMPTGRSLAQTWVLACLGAVAVGVGDQLIAGGPVVVSAALGIGCGAILFHRMRGH